ncbi:odorant receptor 30a-like [Sitophilus oryzae]|uniref:Odorant receptor 30a-like n=1 Tax=Sitophilus oryzae TaxID=7048 RepID=A0A6J2YWL2_SITOR|nr:odorant receptor 30a-like [Sitophilus oryzae]
MFLLIIYYPFQNYFYIMLALEHIGSIWTSLLNSACYTFLNSIMVNVIVQMKIVQYYFKTNIQEGEKIKDEYEADKIFTRAIKKHQEFISYIETLNENIKYAVMIEYFVASLMVANIIILALGGDIFYIFLLIVVSVQLSVFGLLADEIKIQSEQIGLAVYSCNWTTQSKQIRKELTFVIMRSQKALVLRIGPFGPMTAESVVAIFKLAYSYASFFSGIK